MFNFLVTLSTARWVTYGTLVAPPQPTPASWKCWHCAKSGFSLKSGKLGVADEIGESHPTDWHSVYKIVQSGGLDQQYLELRQGWLTQFIDGLMQQQYSEFETRLTDLVYRWLNAKGT